MLTEFSTFTLVRSVENLRMQWSSNIIWWSLCGHGRRPTPKSGGTKSENYWFEKPSFF